MADDKRSRGRFFTMENPFGHEAFQRWAKMARLQEKEVLEPFAGSNQLIEFLRKLDLLHRHSSFDIRPEHPCVQQRDSLASFPTGFQACVTNPPWLARNSATARDLAFPDCAYNDLYKFALEKCLSNCPWVASLVPESFIRSGLFRDRLIFFVSLHSSLFHDTGHPTGLAMFGPDTCQDALVWSGEKEVGWISGLERKRPRPVPNGVPVRFNVHDGNVGFVAVDTSQGPTIRFCDPAEIDSGGIKETSRYYTILQVDTPDIRLDAWNERLAHFRDETCDTQMTSYRGIRKDGMYRRRCDWNLAKGIIHNS